MIPVIKYKYNLKIAMSSIPLRKWRRSCYGQSTNISLGSSNLLVATKIHRRYSSGPPVPISPLANKTLGEFVRARKLDIVLQIYPADMPLGKVIML